MAKRKTSKRKPRQATVNISMPESMRRFVEDRVSEEGFGNVSEFFRDLVREKQRRVDEERRRIVRMIREGIASGPDIELTDEWWEQKKAEWAAAARAKRRKAG